MLECRNAYFHSPCNLGSELESAMESGEFEAAAAGLASLAEEQAEGAAAGEGEVGSSGNQGAVFIAGSPVMGSSPVLGGR